MDEIYKRLKENDPDIRFIYLHMQIGNIPATSFYLKNDFRIIDKLIDFYYNIEPRDCYIMRKSIYPEDDIEEIKTLAEWEADEGKKRIGSDEE
jgi:ribosomal protein S18 acetylase RimI-like enzyme